MAGQEVLREPNSEFVLHGDMASSQVNKKARYEQWRNFLGALKKIRRVASFCGEHTILSYMIEVEYISSRAPMPDPRQTPSLTQHLKPIAYASVLTVVS